MSIETVIAIIGAASVIGGIVGAGSSWFIFSRLNTSKEAKDKTENLLANLVPQETLKQSNDIANKALEILDKFGERLVREARSAIEFAESVTDGKPNE